MFAVSALVKLTSSRFTVLEAFFMGKPGCGNILVLCIPTGLFTITLFEILEPAGG